MMNVLCILCKKPLKPDYKAKNYTSGKWDEHTYFPCVCQGVDNKNLRISVG